MKTKLILGLAATCLITGNMAFATDITPSFTTFGSLKGANFGGNGIPNTDVAAITVITNGNDTITLGLTATQRYSNPPVTNNLAGTFYATPGLDAASPSTYAKWNFDWYINLADNNAGTYSFNLLYGNNTTGASNGFVIPTGTSGLTSTVSGTGQDSWNLRMGFMNVVPTTTIGFDPTADGVYGFELQAFNAAGTMLGETAINVNVGSSVPDAASSTLLLGLGLGSLLLFGYKQNRLTVTK